MTAVPGPNFRGWNNTDPTNKDVGLDANIKGVARATFGDSTATVTSAGAVPNAVVMGRGTSSSPLTTSSDGKNISFYFSTPATGGSTDGVYFRQYFTGAAGGGNALRAFATVSNVQGSTARGLHASLSFGTSGTISGLAAAIEATLHVPETAGMAGTNYAVKAAINADASTSDPVGATSLAFIGIVGQGDSTGLADVSTDANVLDIDGLTAAAGVTNIISSTSLAELPTNIGLRIRANGALYMIPAVAVAAWN